MSPVYPTGLATHWGHELVLYHSGGSSVRDVAVASRPPCSFLRAFGSKNDGLKATATS